MKITNCKVCKKKVSATAPTCPHCGEPEPGVLSPEQVKKKKKETLVGAVVVGLLIVVGVTTCGESPTEAAKRKDESDKKEAACLTDLQCLGEKGVITAGFQCPGLIEKQAKFSVKWVDAALEPKFSRYKWRDKSKQVITFIGDKAQFQNGFGAWMPVTYSCDMQYVGSTWTALKVSVSEGRL